MNSERSVLPNAIINLVRKRAQSLARRMNADGARIDGEPIVAAEVLDWLILDGATLVTDGIGISFQAYMDEANESEECAS